MSEIKDECEMCIDRPHCWAQGQCHKKHGSPAPAGSLCLPIDSRRLQSIAADISFKWSKDTPEREKRAMMWAIEEFHKLLTENKDDDQREASDPS